MPGKVDHLEALAQTTDLLLGSVEPAEMARNFLQHVIALFGAAGGVLHVAAEGEAPHVHNADPAVARQLAAATLAALKQARQRLQRWAGIAALELGAPWPQVVAACPGRAEDEPVLVLGFDRDAVPAHAPSLGLLQLMVRHAAYALENGWLHRRTVQQAERLAVQAEELERVRQALERHSREVERNLAVRSRFFAAMSHELRTPINAILGYSQLLQQGAFEPLRPAQREIAARISASAERLLALVNDVLDFSKIDAGKVEIRRRPVRLDRLIAEAAAEVEATARLKGLALRIEAEPGLPPVVTDPDRVRQILVNLLGNAVKFTHEGSVHVRASHAPAAAGLAMPRPLAASPGRDGWLVISVRDTGIGIPPDRIDDIFGEFVQLTDPTTGRTHGTGLGLAISSRLARLLGGDLTVESQLGVTTTFTLYLPCPEPRIESAVGSR